MCLPYAKRYFEEHQRSNCFFLVKITQILLFSRILVLERSKITVWEPHLFKKKFMYGSFGFVSTLRKKVFSGAPVKCVFLYGSNNSDSVIFRNVAVGEIKDHSLRKTSFQKKICYGSFEFVSTLPKKVFSGTLVKCVFLYGSNNSESVIFGNAAFRETKDHSLRTKSFQKIKFAMGVLGLCLPYVKRYFQEHQLSAFFFMAQITQILLFSGMSLLERSKITVWERHLFKRKFAMEVLSLCLPYLKKYFQEH